MSEEGQQTPVEGEEGGEDPTKNLKAEFGRKFENVDNTLAEIRDQMSRLAEITQNVQSRGGEISDQKEEFVDPYDPNFKKTIEEKAAEAAYARLRKEQEAKEASSQEINGAVAKMSARYPDLNNPNSELAKKALDIYNKLPASQKTGAGIMAAVYEAADVVGVNGLGSNEGFSMGAKSSSKPSKAKDEGDEVDEKTLLTAELFGMDVKDPEVRKRLARTAKEREGNWGRYR